MKLYYLKNYNMAGWFSKIQIYEIMARQCSCRLADFAGNLCFAIS